MYLVHANLRSPRSCSALPPDTAEQLRALARPEERIEHIAVHRPADPEPVLGVYLLADGLDRAEAVVAGFCARALAALPALHGWTVTRVGVPLVTPFYERLLSDPTEAGRIRTVPNPSTGKPFHRP